MLPRLLAPLVSALEEFSDHPGFWLGWVRIEKRHAHVGSAEPLAPGSPELFYPYILHD